MFDSVAARWPSNFTFMTMNNLQNPSLRGQATTAPKTELPALVPCPASATAAAHAAMWLNPDGGVLAVRQATQGLSGHNCNRQRAVAAAVAVWSHSRSQSRSQYCGLFIAVAAKSEKGCVTSGASLPPRGCGSCRCSCTHACWRPNQNHRDLSGTVASARGD